jgi:hypothetical protein
MTLRGEVKSLNLADKSIIPHFECQDASRAVNRTGDDMTITQTFQDGHLTPVQRRNGYAISADGHVLIGRMYSGVSSKKKGRFVFKEPVARAVRPGTEGVSRTRRRTENADEKRFRLRGWKGKKSDCLSPEKLANKARVKSMSSGVKHSLPDLARKHASSHKPRQPWNKKTNKNTKIKVDLTICGDVESNPGYIEKFDCVYQGRAMGKNLQEVVNQRTKLCKFCGVKLLFKKGGKGRGFHPHFEEIPSLVNNTPKPDIAIPVFEERMEPLLQPIPIQPSSDGSETSKSDKFVATLDGIQMNPKLMKRVICDAANVPLIKQDLSIRLPHFGLVRSVDLFRLLGIPFVEKDEIVKTEGTLEYDTERRLAQMRNVPEIKQDMYAVKLSYVFGDLGAAVCKRAITIWLVLMTMSLIAVLTPLAWVGAITTPFLLSLWFSRVWFRSRGKIVTVNYIPHLVSSLVAEFERVPDMSMVSKGIRQKVLRLACLPIPDHSWYELVIGSEQVAMTILKRGTYFGDAAACFTWPHGN